MKKKIIIIKAAIKYKGKIYTGYRHSDIMCEIWKDFPNDDVSDGCMGFMTNTGRFVNRTEAADIAFKAGQIRSGINSLDSYQVFP